MVYNNTRWGASLSRSCSMKCCGTIVTGARSFIALLLIDLPWPPTCYWTKFKILLLVSKVLNILEPVYTRDHLDLRLPFQPLQSAELALLQVSYNFHSVFARRWYFCAAVTPILWNSLPIDLRQVFWLYTYIYILRFTGFICALLTITLLRLVLLTVLWILAVFYNLRVMWLSSLQIFLHKKIIE